MISSGAQRVQLFGLMLIVTTLVLAVTALGTNTRVVRMRSPMDLWGDWHTADVSPPPEGGSDGLATQVQFVHVHVAVPLVIVGLLGLLLWSAPGLLLGPFQRKRRHRRAR
ncbi:MAG: hypothetical protein KatS3mg111_2994 [Pirellulaceae bacterium]|nr:MAG: hypothetical protein KatS3mg111_2994 [Pirellulaceae bacterium]